MFVSGNGYVGFSFARIWGTAESNWFKLARLSIAESGLHAGEAKLWTFMDMNTRSSTRPPWVWVALALQCVLVLLTGYGCVQMLAYWPRYAASGKAAELVIRVFVPAVMAAASLIGVWRTKRWGWILALITDAALCLQGLWFLLDYARFAIRNTAWLAYDLCEFAALAVLLYRPVRGHFLGQNGGPRKATLALARVSRASQAGKPLRILLYFTVAVVASCVATAFSLAIFMGQKNGGSRGFVLFLYFGLTTGCAASFLFVLILTLLVRKFDPSRLWLWVLLGGSLAPCLIFALALIGRWFFVAGPFNLIFWAPETLFQVWWLTPPTGIFTAWVCYTMHPWVFSESRRTRRSA